MYRVGNIDKEIYKCITDDITTDEVIITDERIAHINDRHPNDYEKIEPFFQGKRFIVRTFAKNNMSFGMLFFTGLIF